MESKVTQNSSYSATLSSCNYTMYIVHSEHIMLIVFLYILSKYISTQGSILGCTCLKSLSPVAGTQLITLNFVWKLKM